MQVTTKIVWDMTTGQVLAHDWFHYSGPFMRLKGASAAQERLASSQADFYKTLQQDYGQQFANQGKILSSLQTAWQPILNAGINQFGFSPAETAALRSQATEGTAQTYQKASQALGQNIAAQGGGNVPIPSGASQQLQTELASAAAAQESSANNQITQAGYSQGRSNYLNAASSLGGVAGQYSPVGFAGAANNSGTDAFGSATEVQKMNNAASPWGTIGGILGGVAGSFLGPLGTSLGSKLGSSFAGGGGGDDGFQMPNSGSEYI